MSKLEDVILYAWVGEDEYGSGEIGIKKIITSKGYEALASTKKKSMLTFKEPMKMQSEHYGKKIRLCKFIFREVIVE